MNDEYDQDAYGRRPEENYDWPLIGAAVSVILIAMFVASRCST